MSQVISKSQRPEEFHSNWSQNWRRPVLVAFHGAAASTYGYAICWQNVSAASAQLYARSNPVMRVFGRWRFLTYQCLVMQFVAYSLCFTSHFVPRLRRSKDYFFTTFAFPVGVLVVSSFWAIWFIAGREYIFPVALEVYYPPWLNHITHTIIGPINLAELVLVKHQYTSDRKQILPLVGYVLSYISYLLYIRFQTGRFVYPFLNHMDTIPVGAFITGMAVSVVFIFKGGQLLHKLVHRVKSFKDRYVGKGSRK